MVGIRGKGQGSRRDHFKWGLLISECGMRSVELGLWNPLSCLLDSGFSIADWEFRVIHFTLCILHFDL